MYGHANKLLLKQWGNADHWKGVKVSESIQIKLPWDTLDKIEFTDPVSDSDLDREIAWMVDNIPWTGDDGLERIFRATTVLKAKFPDRPFAQCLQQALIWECG